ncbi:triose-phosphate isomerase (plasmid) [Cupriavidus pinatubonensis]|uniref:triose-phosphate isomerase n=1 Tax=Cupriavidus pinatubonensis TaxID=248026 RepID=UPI001C734F8E|nr:triose-phosphate isomerase [Cupriavidus pinatubonensis]QYY33844.1 triose-phosphate isomerase [Cupriavidus pinatubonensis]
MKNRLVVGNWKMNGSLELINTMLPEMTSQRAQCTAAVCVPSVYLARAAQVLADSELLVGAQDVSLAQRGAYTGEVSASMLSELDCRFAIVGHSERRTRHGETDEVIAEKALRCLEAGIRPIICVGESQQQRDIGRTAQVIGQQLDIVLDRLAAEAAISLERIVVAYEPVWAIGNGRAASVEQAQDAHAYLRQRLGAKAASLRDSVPILYGGSVTKANAADLFAAPDIDGGLVGGASLSVSEFLAILHAA